jgi:hypothetical protein
MRPKFGTRQMLFVITATALGVETINAYRSTIRIEQMVDQAKGGIILQINLRRGPATNRTTANKITRDLLSPPYWGSGCTSEPGPIFWRLPLTMWSVSESPFSTATSSPSVGPRETTRISTLLPLPTT